MLTSETRAALEPFHGELIRIGIVFCLGELHHFAHVVNKAGAISQASTLIQVVKNDDATFILIGNITQTIYYVASITSHKVYIHASKTCSERINSNKRWPVLPNVILQLFHVTKAPVLPECNSARLKIGILITNHA